jgi:hypothetical protein
VVQRRQDLVKHILLVEYCTTAKTSPFTAAAGTGYFINTTCGAVTVTLPATPTAGDVVAFKDYAGQWNTNAILQLL